MRCDQTSQNERPPRGGLSEIRLGVLISPAQFQIAVLSETHSVLTHLPTPPMTAITATSIMPSRTVYSINAAPFSSDLSSLNSLIIERILLLPLFCDRCRFGILLSSPCGQNIGLRLLSDGC